MPPEGDHGYPLLKHAAVAHECVSVAGGCCCCCCVCVCGKLVPLLGTNPPTSVHMWVWAVSLLRSLRVEVPARR